MYCLFTVIYSYVIVHLCDLFFLRGFPGGASGKEPTCQCRRHKSCRFDPWVGKIPWRRAWQPTLVFLPGESPWTKDPGRLQSIGSQVVRQDWSNLACTHTFFLKLGKEMKRIRKGDESRYNINEHSTILTGSDWQKVKLLLQWHNQLW